MVADLANADTDFRVWPENMPIARAFLAAATQWRVITIGNAGLYYQGLVYSDVRAGLEAEDIRLTPMQWAGLRVMEAEARSTLNKVRG